MTVRDAVAVLTDAKALYIGWNGSITDFDKDDESAYEIDIAACPIKEETA